MSQPLRHNLSLPLKGNALNSASWTVNTEEKREFFPRNVQVEPLQEMSNTDNLTALQEIILENPQIKHLIVENILTKEQALGLNRQEIAILEDPSVQSLLKAKTLTIPKARTLTYFQTAIIGFPEIQNLLKAKILTIPQAFRLSRHQFCILCALNQLLINKILNLDQALNLTNQEFNVLKNPTIIDLLLTVKKPEPFTLNDAFALTPEHIHILKHPTAQKMLKTGMMNVWAVVNIGADAIAKLDNSTYDLLLSLPPPEDGAIAEMDDQTILMALAANPQLAGRMRFFR